MLPRFEGQLVDLTLPLMPGMRGVSCEVAATVANQGWNATNWLLYSHAGTHMDAPIHYEASPQSIDQIPLERCMGTAQVVNLADTLPRALLGPECLGDLEATWQPDDILLLRTDWYRRHGTPEYRDALPGFYHYFDLSNEQAFLHERGRIGNRTWNEWRSGIHQNLARPAFLKAWNDVSMRAPDSFDELRRVLSVIQRPSRNAQTVNHAV